MSKLESVLAIVLLMQSAAPAIAEVHIGLSEPERFLDLKMPDASPAKGQEQFTRTMNRELAGLAEKYLGTDQRLHIVFEQVDLAGHVEPMLGRQAQEIRVVTTMDPLRLKFSYTVSTQEGNVLEQGSEDLKTLVSPTDMHGKGKNRELFFERRMMRAWFVGEFGEQ